MTTRSWGQESLANTATASVRGQARTAALANGGFVVVWHESQDSGTAIRAQEFNALGFAISGALIIAEGTIGLPVGNPAVAGVAGGGYLVTWTDAVGAINSQAVLEGVQGPVQVVAAGSVAQTNIVMAPMGTGTAVAWNRGLVVQLRLLDSSGNGPMIDITSQGGAPALAVAPNLARVAVAWNDQTDLRVQLRDAADAAVGGTATVVVPTFGAAFAAQVVWLSNTTFAVAWEQDGPGDAGTDIHLRLFATNGSAMPVPLGDSFIANATRAGDQIAPKLVALPSGGLVLAWHTEGDDGSAVWLQAFDAGGTRIGGEYLGSVPMARQAPPPPSPPCAMAAWRWPGAAARMARRRWKATSTCRSSIRARASSPAVPAATSCSATTR
ncbi:MAG: hypothetical protein NTY94_14880 [Alphaproteobacteria bacterium]|nr:hypothetical protein [Alphaproteobacteria bacterium]